MNDDTATRAAREGFDRTMETGANASALENVRDLNVRLIDMTRVNTEAAFDFEREVATVKGPSDLVQTCATHATKQFDVLTKQASELTTLGQEFAKTTMDSITRVGQRRE